MAVLNFTGFEGGINVDTGNNTEENFAFTGTADLSTTTVRTGTYALRVHPTTTGEGAFPFPLYLLADGTPDPSAGSAATLYAQFYFRYATKPTSNFEEILVVRDTSNAWKYLLALDSNGKLRIYTADAFGDPGAQVGSTGATTLNANTWYQIRLKIGSGATVAYQVQIDGVDEFNSTVAASGAQANNNTAVYFGKNRNIHGNTVDFFYDDIIIDDAAFPSGAVEVKAIKPTANGSTQTWNGGTGSSDYQEVDEIPPSDADYIASPSSGNPNTALFAMQDCATVGITGTILGIKAFQRQREGVSSGATSTVIRLKSGSSNADSGSVNNSTSFIGRAYISLTDPATSTAWTTGGIDSMEMGVIENNAKVTRVSTILGFVAYIPSTSTNYPLTAAQGSFALAGTASGFSVGHMIVALLGSYTLTGTASGLQIARTMVAAVGSYALSGFNAAFLAGKFLTAEVGNYVLGGQDALISSVRTMTAAAGSYVLTGFDTALTIARILTATAGSLVLTGQDTLLSWGRTLVATYGAFVLTGHDVLFQVGRVLTAAYGAVTVTWQNIQLRLNGLLVVFTDKFTRRNTSYSDKHSSRGTDYDDKYTSL